MNAELLGFGEIGIEGTRYDADVVIECGQVRPRRKKPSKPYRDRFGHTRCRPRSRSRGAAPACRDRYQGRTGHRACDR